MGLSVRRNTGYGRLDTEDRQATTEDELECSGLVCLWHDLSAFVLADLCASGVDPAQWGRGPAIGHEPCRMELAEAEIPFMGATGSLN